MITPEQKAEIRRLFFAEHWTVGTIARQLGLHHETVRHALETDRFVSSSAARPSMLDPYKGFIAATLEEYPTLRSTRLLEMLKGRGFQGSAVQVRRYVREVRPRSRAEAYLRLSTFPGEQGQVDWGSFGKLRVGNAERQLSCFVMVLSHSRQLFARFALDQRMESFLLGHVLAFERFGGIPRELLYDNLKSVVLGRVGDHIQFHPRILELAGHYHFAPKPCAPYRGNEKGKVERSIHYLRYSFFEARRYSSLDDLNAQLSRWLAEIASTRKVPSQQRTVAESFLEEQPRLLPLPQHRFTTDQLEPIASGKTPYVRFDCNDYSIPHTLVRKPLTLVASEREIRVLDGVAEVARHTRSYDKARRIETPAHLAALAREKRAAHDLRGRDLLRTCCPNADALLEELARGRSPIMGQTSQLLKLLKTHGPKPLDAAIAKALRKGAFSAESVAHLLAQDERKRKTPPRIPLVLPDDPRIREQTVERHDLNDYDALIGREEDDDE